MNRGEFTLLYIHIIFLFVSLYTNHKCSLHILVFFTTMLFECCNYTAYAPE